MRTALCDLGARVNVMSFSLYKRLYLDKLIPTDISLQMADKSTAIPIGICEDIPLEVPNYLILTDLMCWNARGWEYEFLEYLFLIL